MNRRFEMLLWIIGLAIVVKAIFSIDGGSPEGNAIFGAMGLFLILAIIIVAIVSLGEAIAWFRQTLKDRGRNRRRNSSE